MPQFIITLIGIILAFETGKIRGLKEADYDRDIANLKLQQCQQVITGLNK